jgi:hypothetical protein
MSPSFERLDYQLRYNKHIERRLVFEILGLAAGRFPLSQYQYLGFGSIWFADFRLAHRLLGITDMVSMEYSKYAERARFNIPYRSIRVLPGDSSITLRQFDNAYWERPLICWLDYDGAISPEICADIKYVLEKCANSSVLIVTVNGARGSYRPKIGPDERTRAGTALGQIESLLGASSVPPEMEPGLTGAGFQIDIPESRFPEFLAQSLLTFIEGSTLATGRRVEVQGGAGLQPMAFSRLFNFSHQDGADMVTIGGVVAGTSHSNEWRSLAASAWGVAEYANPPHQALNLIPLTVREKLHLDSCLPHTEGGFLDAASAADVSIPADQLVKYLRYYRHFPSFAEVPL